MAFSIFFGSIAAAAAALLLFLILVLLHERFARQSKNKTKQICLKSGQLNSGSNN